MAFTCHFSTIFSFAIFLLLFIYPSHGAIVSISIGSSPESICPYTPHPNFCTSILPRIRRGATSTIHDYGRFCINRSLQVTNDFISVVNQQISYGSTHYSMSTLRVLLDCQFLGSRNLDFLSTTMSSIRYTNSTLPASEAALLQSVLSAMITNFDTCSDGLQAVGSSSGVTSDLGPHISNGTMLSSVSLALRNYSTISDAVADARDHTEAGNEYFVIYDWSVIDGWTTFNSATFAVVADGFIAVNMTSRTRQEPSSNKQLLSAMEPISPHSTAAALRHTKTRSAVSQDCNIFPRQPLQGQFNTITAQGRTDTNQNTGTSIQGATITAAPDLASSNFTVETYLGRPWKNYSTTVFMESYMDAVINPVGWHEWSGTFALDTLYYAEYDKRGPGSSTTDRVTWPRYHIIDANTAENFTVSNVISGDDWLPATGLPYTDGL
ncbi:putative pectinesterase/pectinesterase inhibitor 41 [Drosera capensis]